MTADDFRGLALAFPGTEERSHMNHPDFRVGNKIFATLTGDGKSGMVKLTPEEQQNYLDAAPEVFTPAAGAWGRQGCTRVDLKAAKVALVRRAMETAFQTTAAAVQSPPRPRKRARAAR